MIAKSGFTFNPDTHVYKLDGKRMTGVTTILGVINKPALIGWAANMACDYVLEHAEKCEPKEGSDEQIYWINADHIEDARKAHTRKKDARAMEGGDVHSLIEAYIKGLIEKNKGEANTAKYLVPDDETTPLNRFITWARENNVQFLESEKVMYHPDWFVGGTADFVCLIDGKKYVGDIKTQKKIWDRVPFFQMAAYRGMLEQMGEEDFHGSLIVHLPMGGELETHFSYDYESELEGFLSALKLYRLLNNY